MKARLTERVVKAAEPDPARKTFIFDEDCRGFALSIAPSGSKRFVLDYTLSGRQRRLAKERFLTTEEISRLAKVLDAESDRRGADILRMCMLTGARLGEVRCARFDQFNLELGIWTKQAADTKQRRVHRLPISQDTVALVRSRRAAVGAGCDWLFPGQAPDRRLCRLAEGSGLGDRRPATAPRGQGASGWLPVALPHPLSPRGPRGCGYTRLPGCC